LRVATLKVGGTTFLASTLKSHQRWDAPPTLNGGLALSLFVFRVFADDSDNSFTFDDFTFITDFLDGGPYLHDPISPGK
jgi:hypothetical protein